MKRLLLPGIPFALSLGLSLSTAGARCHWQDSGFYLTAVKELGVLYPPGFALYLLLCKSWTVLLGFVDFTYAVHLFSAFCAAGAAGTIAVAARDLLRTRGPLFRTAEEDGVLAEGAGIAVGCLAAAGYTFWAAAILAKGYAFFYLILSLLLWRMVRADASGKPRDFTIVAALIGVAWQAHPSATNAGLALALFVAFHRRLLGATGIAWRTGLAAACALVPSLLLPVFAARRPALMFGDPQSAGEWLAYVAGLRFTGIEGAFGLSGSRVAAIGRYFWEEFLAVGGLAVALGLARIARRNRTLLAGVAAWVVPVLVVTTLFKLEGQHDLWFVSAWIVLWMAGAVGLHAVAAARDRRLAAVAAGAGLVWAVVANHPSLDQRDYRLADTMGRLHLDALDPDAVLVLHSDDAAGSALYQQRVKGVRPDVAIVQDTMLGWNPGWYEQALRGRRGHLQVPDYAELRGRFPKAGLQETATGAFANANFSKERPLFFEKPPPPEVLRADATLVPAGHLLKMVARGEQRVDPKYWSTPIEAEAIPPLFRRERGQFVERIDGGLRVRPEAYEHRLLRELLRARKNRADWVALAGTPEGYQRSAELYESILQVDPGMGEDPGAVVPLARAYYALRRYEKAEPWLRKSVAMAIPPGIRAQLCCMLVEIYRAWNRPEDAKTWTRTALSIPELPPELRSKLER